MIVLGINDGHGASAALMIGGEIVGIVQEERLTKVKNQTGFPKLAIEELVVSHLGSDFGRIDEIALGTLSLDPHMIALDHYSEFGVADWVKENHDYWKPVFYGDPKSVENYWHNQLRTAKLNRAHNFDFAFLERMDRAAAGKHFNEVTRLETFKLLFGREVPIRRYRHHECHAAYALYGGEMQQDERAKAVVLTADAWGDGENWAAFKADNGALTRLAGGADHVVARIYKFATLILGMKPNEHEYKVMGLSAYCAPTLRYVTDAAAVFFDAVDFENGKFIFPRQLRESYFDLKDRLEGHRFDNIAAGMQLWASQVTAKWAAYWLSEVKRDVLCFSGGLSMNIKLNGDLLGLPELRTLSIPASGGDESISAGACFMHAIHAGNAQPLQHAYLGRTAELDGSLPTGFIAINNVGPAQLARLLSRDIIVARCAGRGEFGARSLGNRSILANPSNPDNLRRINQSVKNRDFWMPFTPSIQAEYADQYLTNPKGMFSPYMTVGFSTKPEAHSPLAAALHPADRSARPQMVRKQDNCAYWEIIEEFRKITGIAALLNTSLNLHGEPMNYTVADALRTVKNSDLWCLALPGNRLACKSQHSQAVNSAMLVS